MSQLSQHLAYVPLIFRQIKLIIPASWFLGSYYSFSFLICKIKFHQIYPRAFTWTQSLRSSCKSMAPTHPLGTRLCCPSTSTRLPLPSLFRVVLPFCTKSFASAQKHTECLPSYGEEALACLRTHSARPLLCSL